MAKNNGQFKKGHIPANKGTFKELVCYNTLHRWIQRHFVKTGICDNCMQAKKTEWSAKDGKYTRLRSDYEELCISCHRFKDRKNPTRVNYEGGIIYG